MKTKTTKEYHPTDDLAAQPQMKNFKFKYKIKKDENCFSYLPKLSNELTIYGNEYLERFNDGKSNADLIEDVWQVVSKFTDVEIESHPERDLIDEILDGWMPYTQIPRNGSLWFSLGFSVVAMEANLRMMREYFIGSEPILGMDLPICVPKELGETSKR